MDINIIKILVQNYNWATNEDIEEILKYIVRKHTLELGTEVVFNIEYEEGAAVKNQRTDDGKLQLEVGILNFYNARERKEMNQEYESDEERKEFIELILSTYHELRHIEQINNIIDNPVYNEMNFKITRELIINEAFPGFITVFNYETSISEIDAIKTSLLNTINFFLTMETNITPNEIFEVMKEKELSYLNYNLELFGSDFKTAIKYFDEIYYQTSEIKGYQEMQKLLSEDKKIIFNTYCNDLQIAYNLETKYENKLNILMEMALILMPELYEKYPLLKINNQKIR